MLSKGNYMMPLVKFVEKLEGGQSMDFGNFSISRDYNDYIICSGRKSLTYFVNEFVSKLNDEGILEDNIIKIDLGELIFDFGEYDNGYDYFKVNRILNTIVENKMNFEILDSGYRTFVEYRRELKEDEFKVYWTDGENYYENIKLDLILTGSGFPEVLRVFGDGNPIRVFVYDSEDTPRSDSSKSDYKIYVANIAILES